MYPFHSLVEETNWSHSGGKAAAAAWAGRRLCQTAEPTWSVFSRGLSSQRCSSSPSGFLLSCTHSLPCSFHLSLTPAFLTSEWASLNASLVLPQPSLSLTKWEKRHKSKDSSAQFSVERVTPTLGRERNLRIIANETRGRINGQTLARLVPGAA